MILDIDVGNSRLKWRLASGNGSILRHGSCDDESSLELLEVKDGSPEVLERIRVGTVKGPNSELAIREIAQRCWGLSPEFARPVRDCAGVVNAYSAPQTLGVDRWLATLAAYNDCHKACCVVDAGSAATFDVVSDGGQHIGGYIVPGLAMQKRSLQEGTSIRLSIQEEWPADPRLATNTARAVHDGILTMLVDWVQHEYQAVAADADCSLYLTGGDAILLSSHLTKRGVIHTVVPDLVLNGLAFALP